MGEETRNSKNGYWVSPPVGILGDELWAEMKRRLSSMGMGRGRLLAASGLGSLAGKQDSTHFVT